MHVGLNPLQCVLGDEECQLHRAVVCPKTHGAPRCIECAALIGKTQRHRRPFRSYQRCEIAQASRPGDHVALLKPLREPLTAPIFEPGFIESLTSGVPPRLETFCRYSFAITMSNKLSGPSKRRCNARAFFVR